MINSNATVLRWNTALNMQEYQRSFMQNYIAPIPVELNYVPPFQLPRPATGDAITLFKLVYVTDGTETDITSEIATAGLTVLEFVGKDYDLISFPSLAAVPSVSFDLGAYYAVMSDGTSTWYSEVFTMVASVAEMIKISWCHAEDFVYPGGHIDYGGNYQNYLHVQTDIGKPSYQYDEEVKNLDGYILPEKQVSFKVWQMEFLAGESVIDAIRLIRLHDIVTITNNRDGRTYTIDDFLMNEPDWSEVGNTASLTVEFRTDTIAVVSGRGVLNLLCGATSSSEGETACLAADFECVATIEEGGAEWTGEYYEPAGGGPNVPFVTDDYVMVLPLSGTGWRLYQYNGAGYTEITSTAEDEIAYDLNDQVYYWQNLNPTGNIWLTTWISAVLNKDSGGAVTSPTRLWTAYGQTLQGAIVEIFTFDDVGNETLAGTGTHDDFVGLGVEFVWTAAAVGARAKVSTPTCNRFDTSDDFDFEGVNYWEIPVDNEVQ